MVKPTVFIHTNAKQRIGALVARHSLIRNSAHPERFNVELLFAEESPALQARQGPAYLREGTAAIWNTDDLQSFVPLRFSVPERVGFEGRAIVIDPDVFAVGDVNELLERDMHGKAIMARRMPASGHRASHFASSVMLLDCVQLGHWRYETDFGRLFEGTVDYRDWMWLLREPETSIGELESRWNDFDHLGPETRLLHNTHRRTQPWKTGLRADFTPRGTTPLKRLGIWARHLGAAITGGSPTGYYRAHPDPAQERYFFTLLAECVKNGSVDERLIRTEIENEHVRPDTFSCLRAAAAAA